DDGGGYVMVLEDLDASGCTYPGPSDADIGDRAASTVEELAHLHASHWEDPRFADELCWVPERAGFGAGGGKNHAAATNAGRFVRHALDRFATDMPAVFSVLGALYADRAGDVLD